MSKNSIKLSIDAKDRASQVLKDVKASTVALGVMIGNLASKAITSLINQTRSFIDAALECERANMAVTASLRAMGEYTPELDRQMKDLAGTIQDEIGGSDEYFKDIISQLITVGVASENIDQATRAVTALEAIGRKGSRAMQAVARAVEGDYSAFSELIPAVRTATTDAEKLAIINQTLAAGYAQQQDNLTTVGGAWEALKGRLGDAQEAFTNSIFEGLKLSDTFGTMQVAVGNFLQSEQWDSFLEHLKNGAAFAKDLATSLTSTSGFKAVGVSLGNVILAALKDGADYLKNQIKDSLGRQDWEEYRQQHADDPVTRGARYLAARFTGASHAESKDIARDRTWADDPDDTTGDRGGGRLTLAIEELKNTVAEHSKKTDKNTDKIDENTDKVNENTEEEKKAPALTINVEAQRAKQQKELDAVNARIAKQQEIDDKAAAQAKIAAEGRNIADAERRIAAADRVIEGGQGPAEALRRHNQQIAEEKATAREDEKIMKRYKNLKERQEAAGGLKLRLSSKDQALVDAVDAEKERQGLAAKAKADAEADKEAAEERKIAAEKQLAEMQKDQLTELKQIRAKIEQALTVGS